MDNIEKQLRDLLPQSDVFFKKDEPLAHHTTFKIGGKAQYFYLADSKDRLITALKAAFDLSLPFFVLGGGSNVLVSDKGFKGLIIKNYGGALKIEGENIYAEAGVPLKEIVERAAQNSLQGMEFLFDIPGTLGGAIRGNAGAFGGEIKDILSWVEILDEKGKVRKLETKECQFNYRDSRFKHQKEIILSAKLTLKRGDKLNIYKKIAEIFKKRRSSFSNILPSAGSVFKNIFVKDLTDKVKEKFDIEKLKRDDKFPVKYLIEEIDFRERKIGEVQISWEHPNVIVNLGQGKAEEVIILIGLIKQKIRTKFNIQLQEEIEYVGF